MGIIRKTLVCSACNVVPEVITKEFDGDTIRCPICGRDSNLSEATELAIEHLKNDKSSDILKEIFGPILSTGLFDSVSEDRDDFLVPGFIYR